MVLSSKPSSIILTPAWAPEAQLLYNANSWRQRLRAINLGRRNGISSRQIYPIFSRLSAFGKYEEIYETVNYECLAA